jgi:hypothetical protein
LLDNLQQAITVKWLSMEKISEISPIVVVIDLIHQANEEQAKADSTGERKVIKFDNFYNQAVNDDLSLREDYRRWITGDNFSFCNYPFMLDPASKSKILQIECAVQQHQRYQDALLQSLVCIPFVSSFSFSVVSFSLLSPSFPFPFCS